MIKVYLIFTDTLKRNDLIKLFNVLDVRKKEKVNRYVRLNDAIRSILGNVLVKYALNREYKLPLLEANFLYNDYSKPSLINRDDIHFNISHSHHIVVCAVGDKKVGIDVEKIEQISEAIINYVCNDYEKNMLMNMNEKDRIEQFISLWTCKEGYAKCIGKGLAIPFKQIYTKAEHCFNKENGMLNIKRWKILNDFFITVCTSDNYIDNNIENVYINDLLNFVEMF